jgi:hypothetical protein
MKSRTGGKFKTQAPEFCLIFSRREEHKKRVLLREVSDIYQINFIGAPVLTYISVAVYIYNYLTIFEILRQH